MFATGEWEVGQMKQPISIEDLMNFDQWEESIISARQVLMAASTAEVGENERSQEISRLYHKTRECRPLESTQKQR